MIDLTLDKLKRPVIPGLVPSFGTTVEVTDKNKGGLSTTEVDANIALAYELQREVNVSTSDTTSIVEHDAKVALIGDEAITLTLQGASYGGCELKITNRGSQTATVVYNDSDRIEVEPTDHLRMVWTAREWWVENAKTPQEQGTNIQTYTYVVDSDQALIDWANNDRNKGQDYTSVLIKRGTWTSTIGVNLTNAGTKVVVGEADSKLVFNDVAKGLYYDALTQSPEHYMTGVCIVTTPGTVSRIDSSHGFYYCSNLTNCRGLGTSRVTGSGFSFCSNLTNCEGEGIGESTVYGIGYGFYFCSNLTNCVGEGLGIGIGENTGNGYGFCHCSNLTNCEGTGLGTSPSTCYGYGFDSCSNIANCKGVGKGLGAMICYGYGFRKCVTVSRCQAGGECTTAVFDSCYASNSNTSTYACADTANGGFNDTTNPRQDEINEDDLYS